jgi:hypothetical protein
MTMLELELLADVDLDKGVNCEWILHDDSMCGRPATHRVKVTCCHTETTFVCDEHFAYMSTNKYQVYPCGCWMSPGEFEII